MLGCTLKPREKRQDLEVSHTLIGTSFPNQLIVADEYRPSLTCWIRSLAYRARQTCRLFLIRLSPVLADRGKNAENCEWAVNQSNVLSCFTYPYELLLDLSIVRLHAKLGHAIPL